MSRPTGHNPKIFNLLSQKIFTFEKLESENLDIFSFKNDSNVESIIKIVGD